jgi:hypothetical protein
MSAYTVQEILFLSVSQNNYTQIKTGNSFCAFSIDFQCHDLSSCCSSSNTSDVEEYNKMLSNCISIIYYEYQSVIPDTIHNISL